MISECSKIDELMMDFIYQELEPAAAADVKSHVDGCARCGAELASLSRTRQAMRSIADVEPPAGVSALLLHEAAKRKPAVAKEEGGGIWAAILKIFGPIQAHPAMAAVASIVLVAGIAGYLSKRGMVSDKAPAITSESSEDLKLTPKAGLEVRLDGDLPAAAPSDPAPAAAAAPEGGSGGELDRAKASEKADSTSRRGIAADDARERWGSLASKEEQQALAPAKKKATKGDALDDLDGVIGGDANHMGGAGSTNAYGSSGYAAPPPADSKSAVNAPKPEPSKLRALDQENTVPPARPRTAQGEDAWSREESEAAGSMAQGETRQTKDGGRVASKPAAPAPVTSTATATPGLAQPQAQAPAQTRAPSGKQQQASSTQLHNEAAKKAKSGSCAEALALRTKLYKTDPSYYDKAVRVDRSFDSCLSAERKRAKPAMQRDKAADEAAPTPAEQKSVKQSAN